MVRRVEYKVLELEKNINQNFQEIKDNTLREAERLRRVDKSLLKMILNSPTAPPEERIKAGLELIIIFEENGWIKKSTIGISKKHIDTYKAIRTARPKFRVPEIEDAIEGAQ